MNNVLIITNKGDLTCDYIVKELHENSISFFRLNTEEITKSIFLTFDFQKENFFVVNKHDNTKYNLLEFTAVYYRRPELPTLELIKLSNGERNFINDEIIYTLEGLYKILKNAYWISPIYSIRESENKIYQLSCAKSIGFKIPDTIVTNSYNDSNIFYLNSNKNCIIKPIKAGLIEDGNETKVVFTSKINEFPQEKSTIEKCPILIQNLIEKLADIRVTLVGAKVFATKIESQKLDETKVDWRKGKVLLEHSRIKLPKDIEEKCVSLLKLLNLRFGAIDLVLTKNEEYIFLEINPNGQWAWIENQTGYEISKEIVNLLINEDF